MPSAWRLVEARDGRLDEEGSKSLILERHASAAQHVVRVRALPRMLRNGTKEQPGILHPVEPGGEDYDGDCRRNRERVPRRRLLVLRAGAEAVGIHPVADDESSRARHEVRPVGITRRLGAGDLCGEEPGSGCFTEPRQGSSRVFGVGPVQARGDGYIGHQPALAKCEEQSERLFLQRQDHVGVPDSVRGNAQLTVGERGWRRSIHTAGSPEGHHRDARAGQTDVARVSAQVLN